MLFQLKYLKPVKLPPGRPSLLGPRQLLTLRVPIDLINWYRRRARGSREPYQGLMLADLLSVARAKGYSDVFDEDFAW